RRPCCLFYCTGKDLIHHCAAWRCPSLIRSFSRLFVLLFFTVIHQIDCVAADGEGLFGGASGLEGYAGGGSLPGGCGAGGISENIFRFPFLLSFGDAVGKGLLEY